MTSAAPFVTVVKILFHLTQIASFFQNFFEFGRRKNHSKQNAVSLLSSNERFEITWIPPLKLVAEKVFQMKYSLLPSSFTIRRFSQEKLQLTKIICYMKSASFTYFLYLIPTTKDWIFKSCDIIRYSCLCFCLKI